MLKILSALRCRLRMSKDSDHLASMPDHILKDIGIGRSEILYLTRAGRDVDGLTRRRAVLK
jgi:uncharacterized protein YjiS (DUF1127 family)